MVGNSLELQQSTGPKSGRSTALYSSMSLYASLLCGALQQSRTYLFRIRRLTHMYTLKTPGSLQPYIFVSVHQ